MAIGTALVTLKNRVGLLAIVLDLVLGSLVPVAGDDGGLRAASPPIEIAPLGALGLAAPTVAAGPTGFVAAWEQDLDDRDRTIFARRINLHGGVMPGPFRADDPVAPFGVVFRILPDLALDADGSFVVVWHDIWDREVHARRFGPDDRPRGSGKVVNRTEEHWQIYPSIVAAPGGGFVVGWTTGGVGDDGEVWPPIAAGQRLDRHGRRVGPELRLNGDVGAEDQPVQIAVGIEGEIFATWLNGFPPGLYGRRLSSVGLPAGPEVAIGGPLVPEASHSLCALPGGRFLAAWVELDGGVLARAVEADASLGPRRQVDAVGAAPRLGCDRFGDALVVYGSRDGALAAQRLGPDGEPRGAALIVSEAREAAVASPAVALGPGGRALVVWEVHDGSSGTLRSSITGRLVDLEPVGCTPTTSDLCLRDGRFRLRAYWRNPYGPGSAIAHARPLSDDNGTFWFFGENNLELAAKVLDGRRHNGRFWFLAGSLTTVEHWIEVTDTATGQSRTYHNPPGQQRGYADTVSFLEPLPLPSLPIVDEPRRVAGVETTTAGSGPCAATATRLCLGSDRFAVEVSWRIEAGSQGAGLAVPITEDTGAFWFFSEDNLELFVKVLDGQSINGHFWVLWGGLTSLEYAVTVTDLVGGTERAYHRPAGSLAGGTDINAFP